MNAIRDGKVIELSDAEAADFNAAIARGANVANELRKDAINQEANRRILAVYPIWKQLNLLRSPDTEESISAFTWIDSVRCYANALMTDPAGSPSDMGWPVNPS